MIKYYPCVCGELFYELVGNISGSHVVYAPLYYQMRHALKSKTWFFNYYDRDIHLRFEINKYCYRNNLDIDADDYINNRLSKETALILIKDYKHKKKLDDITNGDLIDFVYEQQRCQIGIEWQGEYIFYGYLNPMNINRADSVTNIIDLFSKPAWVLDKYNVELDDDKIKLINEWKREYLDERDRNPQEA